LTYDSDHAVVGFTVDQGYVAEAKNIDLPVVDYARVECAFPPENHAMIFAVGPHQTNSVRRDRYNVAKRKGYDVGTYVSSRAITWPDLTIGEGVLVFEGTVVQPFVRIGRNTVVRSGVHLSHHVVVGDHCFISPGANLGGGAIIEDECVIGLSATVRDHVIIAQGCFIAAGAVVVAHTEPDGLYTGVPARRSRKPAHQIRS
jgi:sugar O-acyltransferase (sialic acid O-acetyltransferase NeuD family)